MSSVKVKKVIKEMVENGGSLGNAIRKAGYSEAYAKNPQKITKTKAWEDFMQEYFSDDSILYIHKELLEAQKPVRNNNGAVVDYDPDYPIRLRALDMAYKLKGRYKPMQFAIPNPYEHLSIEELDNEIQRLNKELNRSNS